MFPGRSGGSDGVIIWWVCCTVSDKDHVNSSHIEKQNEEEEDEEERLVLNWTGIPPLEDFVFSCRSDGNNGLVGSDEVIIM